MLSASSRREQGFTLIELLVVMIIISILMAVAVPTFLSQKNTALKTQATANIKNVVSAVESCASQITTGGYNDGTTNCSTEATLTGYEASLSNLKIGTAVPATPADTQVVLDTSNQGYMVQKMINDSGQVIYFAEIHTKEGGLLKLCGTTALTMTSTTGTKVAASKTCKQGTW